MATVGEQLLQPESGWRRYDDTHESIKYHDLVNIGASLSGAYNGTYSSYNIPEGETFASFKFIGSKIRWTARINIGYSEKADIYIDGNNIGSASLQGDNAYQILVFDFSNLEYKEHIVKIVLPQGGTVNLDAIDIDETGELLPPPAQVGDQLLDPEEGWKRYDDRHPAIKYEGNWIRSNITGYFNGTTTGTDSNGEDSYSFKFIGTKIRLVDALAENRSSSVRVIIDGVEESYSAYGPSTARATLVYEKTGLEFKEHTVEVINSLTRFIALDAIDIDENGRFLHESEALTPDELTIGKRIRAHYSAPTSGQVGIFSNLGEETYVDGINDFIPPESSTTPDGDFYYICVDEYNGKKILVADRNIQHSISWDTLNSEGIPNTGLPITIEEYDPSLYSFTTRLLTGGISSSDKDNEWDKYIVEGTGNGRYVAGDDEVWHWDISVGNQNTWFPRTWTSSTPSSNAQHRVLRGQSLSGISPAGVDAFYTALSNEASNVRAFRPVLEIESLTPPSINKYLFEDNGEVKKWDSLNNIWITISPAPATEQLFLEQGMDNLDEITDEGLQQLVSSSPKLLHYTDDASKESSTMSIQAVPHGQLVFPEGDIEVSGGVENININIEFEPYVFEGLIPTLNSNQSNIGEVIYNHEYSSGYRGWMAFDDNDNTRWAGSTNPIGYIGFRFIEPQVVSKYYFKALAQKPYNYQFEGRNDNSNWEILHEVKGETWLSDEIDKTHIIDNNESYSHYRLHILNSNEFGPSISELKMYKKNSYLNLNCIVSPDQSFTWYSFNGEWQPIEPTKESVKLNGMTPDVVSNLTKEQIDSLLNGSTTLRFAYYLEQEELTDTVYVDTLTISSPPAASETPVLEGINLTYDELTIEGRMKDLEKTNAINMAKLNFKANALIQSERYNLHDLVIDTFEDTTGVESMTATYSNEEKAFTGTGEVILLPEQVDVSPHTLWIATEGSNDLVFEYLSDNQTWVEIAENNLHELNEVNITELKIKIKLPSSNSKLSAVSVGWA
ncbi:hypothetical protein [Oceanobacillus profundus]|uniref:F5/8 type C domain-containing protein n=1 Tax=Oceanobacillus profundus TaxID=372463 RepID=A0A417YGQ9_9BACI|nr:hypothetical protein [Oceanobacillus profundus]RHW32008.1 hypothetical protein D1B32_12290 [Oceanobacillus profundus]